MGGRQPRVGVNGSLSSFDGGGMEAPEPEIAGLRFELGHGFSLFVVKVCRVTASGLGQGWDRGWLGGIRGITSAQRTPHRQKAWTVMPEDWWVPKTCARAAPTSRAE
jgi:hypothetical protein